MNASYFSEDIQDFLVLLNKYRVRYLIVGGEAVIFHGYPRLTGDVDFFYDRTEANVSRLFDVLLEFWEGDIPGVASKDELGESGIIIQFGVPPNRMDLLNELSGITFQEAWEHRINETLSGPDTEIPVYYIGKNELIKNKQSAGRPKDLEDLDYL